MINAISKQMHFKVYELELVQGKKKTCTALI